MTTLRFVGELPLWAGLLIAALLGGSTWWYYRRERANLPGHLRWLLPLLRASAVVLVVLMLVGPVIHRRQVIGQLGRVLVFVDGSRSMTVKDTQMPTARKLGIAQQHGWLPHNQIPVTSKPADSKASSAIAVFDHRSRWQRAEHSLLNTRHGLLRSLAELHRVTLYVLAGKKAGSLWQSETAATPPQNLGKIPASLITDLATGIAQQTRGATPIATDSHAPDKPAESAAVVLLSDGQHNAHSSPTALAHEFALRGIPVYTIGYGCQNEPTDIAIVRIEHPTKVFQKDRVRGTLVLQDYMPAGEPLLIQIQHGDEILWQQRTTTQDTGLRRIDFEFSVDSLASQIAKRFAPGVRHHAIPLALTASITPLDAELDTTNNTAPLRIMAITQNHKLLLLDGRPRWETRYLRNMFQRDDQWHVDTVLADAAATGRAALSTDNQSDRFPPTEEKLFEYDLIIIGEIPSSLLDKRQQRWIRDFVERHGGGLVFIDGRREQLRKLDNRTLGPLLPIAWTSTPLDLPATRLQLTDAGAAVSAFMLQSSAAANRSFWQQLPAPHRIIPVEALPGAEVLVEATVKNKTWPAVVTRSFGAGRVLYFAFDETWRWRYKVADKYHQRFWHQVAKWIMVSPFTVSNRFMALDSGTPSYTAGQSATIRVRLQNADGQPYDGAGVDALLWKNGQLVATIALTRDQAGMGFYRGETGPLHPGEFTVTIRAAGLNRAALNCKTGFVVVPQPSTEMQYLACNNELLSSIAVESHGKFLPEEEIDQLLPLLQPLSSGRVLETDIRLRQSYWWFAAIIGLLTLEWTLRKRAGLL